MMKVILDTNFLIYCAKQKIDYAEEIEKLLNENYELVVPSSVIKELEELKLKAKKGKDKEAAALSLQILEFRKIKKIKTKEGIADKSILDLAGENKKNIVCTIDKEMRSFLGRVILLSRKRLILVK